MNTKILLEKPKADSNFLLTFLDTSTNGIRKFYTLVAAIDLELFELLKKPRRSKEIAEKLNCNEKLINLLCKTLCDLGFLRKTKNGYVNTGIANAFLVKDSPYSQVTYIKNKTKSLNLWLNLAEIIKKGPIKLDSEFFFSKRAIHSLAQASLLGEVQKTVKIVSKLPEFQMAKKLLDLGGGHGLYAIAFASINPKLNAYVFDLPGVIEWTKKYVEIFKAKRVHVIPGNFFTDDLGNNYDIIFSSYNPGGKKGELIPKIHSSLKAGGLYINKQIFPNKDVSLLDLEWNLWSFGMKKGKRAYTFEGDLTLKEYVKRLKEVGFKVLKIINFNRKWMTKMIIAKKI